MSKITTRSGANGTTVLVNGRAVDSPAISTIGIHPDARNEWRGETHYGEVFEIAGGRAGGTHSREWWLYIPAKSERYQCRSLTRAIQLVSCR